mmetsp:Transcript_72002/g.114150  ORF Transcript_72002/g.114150 Transcript_72002/m.114150 type:complete len:452 (-) Transcript_72002:51-1406(-)|eukprot:CAMPEP_0169176756 /NCGR_PEP_ID=MMETSP1015-20121227/66039_1 /TAXON_ID=342587 /ORGANISM="Karlodinium micrum, Strain CCMP2283" /LENGTH=451 /DNA_ID=CAMNT_0009251283 /DNA_START=73 /DNA_END=1428 /DNA_ORIENTATION=-
MYLIFSIILVLARSPSVIGSRVRPAVGHDITLTQTKGDYDEAADFSPTWNTLEGMLEENTKMQNKKHEEPTPESVKESLEFNVHMIFKALQGQPCMDLCAVCMPTMEDMQSGGLQLHTIELQRSKSARDQIKSLFTGVVNTTLGAVVGAVAGVLPALGLGIAGGVVQGKSIGGWATNSTGTTNTGPGMILGLLAGISSGVVLGLLDIVLIEALAVLVGGWKGVGITPALTKCGRLGFVSNKDGEVEKEQPFNNVLGDSNYGLKKLRQWMEANKDWRSAQLLEEILPYDSNAIDHCEKLRHHDFDMRHATQCIRHSKLCGDQGGFVLPIPSSNMCRQISDFKYLEDAAVKLGDDPKEGFFAGWRKMQEEIKKQTGQDGEHDQCIRLLCEFNGYKKASLKFHHDKVDAMDIAEKEKQKLKNTMTFLNRCKDEHKLRLDLESEREELCGDFSDV